METIKDYLDCGAVKESSTGVAGGTSLAVGSSRTNILTLKVFKFSDIFEKIVPLFNKYKVLGVKSEDFNS